MLQVFPKKIIFIETLLHYVEFVNFTPTDASASKKLQMLPSDGQVCDIIKISALYSPKYI